MTSKRETFKTEPKKRLPNLSSKGGERFITVVLKTEVNAQIFKVKKR